MKHILLLLIFSISLAFNSYSQWQQTGGPSGGELYQFSRFGQTWVVSAGNGGIFRSVDNAQTWSAANIGLPEVHSIQDLINDEGILFCSVYANGVYMSTDTAKTWSPVNNGIENESGYTLGSMSGKLLYGLANGGVLYSGNSGTSWSNRSMGVQSEQIQDFAFIDNKILAAGSNLFSTTDDGLSWTPINVPGLGLNGARTLATNKGVIYVADDGFVHVSKDTLKTWHTPNVNMGGSIINSRVVGDTVLMTTAAGKIYFTIDQGDSWSFVQNTLVENSFVRDCLANGAEFWMTTLSGMYYSSDAGQTWKDQNSGLLGLPVSAFSIQNSNFYAGTNNGVYQSEDDCKTWFLINNEETEVNDIIQVGTKLLLASSSGVIQSIDSGKNWTNMLIPGINKSVTGLSFNSERLIAVINGQGLYLSNDTAKTWDVLNTPGIPAETGYHDLLLKGDTILLASANSEIFLSTDFAQSWTNIAPANQYIFPYHLRFVGARLYLASAQGLFYTDDLGSTWTQLHNDSTTIFDMIQDGDRILGATNGGLRITSLQRDLWTDEKEGLENIVISKLEVSNDTVYAASTTGGVWKRGLADLNLPPIIMGVSESISFPEDSLVTINLGSLLIDDPDNSFPDEFSLDIQAGSFYEKVSANSLQPLLNYNGELTVDVTVSDLRTESEAFSIKVDITPVNDIPQIIEQSTIVVAQGRDFTIELDDLIIEDPDNNSVDFKIIVYGGENYIHNQNTIIPNEGFEGILNVPIQVKDLADTSDIYNAKVEVSAVAALDKILNSDDLYIYPNPSNNIINFELPKDFPVNRLFIYTIDGQLKSELSPVDDLNAIDISKLNKGIYYIRIVALDRRPVLSGKFIKD